MLENIIEGLVIVKGEKWLEVVKCVCELLVKVGLSGKENVYFCCLFGG